MKFSIKHVDGSVAFETDAESMAQALNLTIKARVNRSKK